MLELLTICIALAGAHSNTAPIDPLIGIWKSAEADTFEFRQDGRGHDYVKIIGFGLEYQWEQIGNQIEFTYSEDIPSRSCLFTINDNMLTLSQCNIATSELKYVRVWSGKKVKLEKP